MAIVTKSNMIEALNDSRPGFIQQYIGKALVAIFNFQTEDEKSANSTDNNNNIGFTGSDAKDGSITAKYFLKNGTLLDWMVDSWLKDFRGSPRITKYARQLNMVAAIKSAKAEAKPRFTHDDDAQDKAVFIGRDGIFDVWFHAHWNEVVLRFGDNPQDCRALDMQTARKISDYTDAVRMIDLYLNK